MIVVTLIVVSLWVTLIVMVIRKGQPVTTEAPSPSFNPRETGALVILGLSIICFEVLNMPPLNNDEWLYMGLGRWIQTHFFETGALFTEMINPTEPSVRVLALYWHALDLSLFGDSFPLWRIESVIAHGLVTLLVYKLAQTLCKNQLAATIAAVVFAFHPTHNEVLTWFTSGRENMLMAGFFIAAIIASLNDRPWLTAVLGVLAWLSREHAFALIVVVPLVHWFYHQLSSSPAVRPLKERLKPHLPLWSAAAAIIGWRIWMTQDSESQAGYLMEMLSDGPVAFVQQALIDIPALAVTPFWALPGQWQAVAALITGISGLLLLIQLSRITQRKTLVLWTLFALVWAAATLGPSIADLHWPTEPAPEHDVPAWHLHHLYLPMVGPCLALGWALSKLTVPWTRWLPHVIALVLITTLMISLSPYHQVSARVQSATSALKQQTLPDHAAIRFVEPTDPVAALVLYGRAANPTATVAPVLVGEPRCGCVIHPMTDPAQISKARDVAQIIAAPLRIVPSDPGASCLCTPWRQNAVYYRFDGNSFVRP